MRNKASLIEKIHSELPLADLAGLVLVLVNLRCQEVADVAHVTDGILDDERALLVQLQCDGGGERCRFGELREVALRRETSL
jgi:hypothetical protein